MMASAQIQTHHLPSSIDSLALVEQLIEDFRNLYHIPEDLYGNILVSVTEAINNAIRHGNKEKPDQTISFSFESSEDEYRFIIEDKGPGFDFENVPDPTHPDNIEKPDGRGIFIMKSLADEVAFEEGGSKVIVRFKRS